MGKQSRYHTRTCNMDMDMDMDMDRHKDNSQSGHVTCTHVYITWTCAHLPACFTKNSTPAP